MDFLHVLWADLPLSLEHPVMRLTLFALLLTVTGIFLARNEGQRFAWLVVQLIVALSDRSIEVIDEEEVKRLTGALYGLLPGRFWLLPWKLLISETMVARMAWEYIKEVKAGRKAKPKPQSKADSPVEHVLHRASAKSLPPPTESRLIQCRVAYF